MKTFMSQIIRCIDLNTISLLREFTCRVVKANKKTAACTSDNPTVKVELSLLLNKMKLRC